MGLRLTQMQKVQKFAPSLPPSSTSISKVADAINPLPRPPHLLSYELDYI